jgi:hypothetical protein
MLCRAGRFLTGAVPNRRISGATLKKRPSRSCRNPPNPIQSPTSRIQTLFAFLCVLCVFAVTCRAQERQARPSWWDRSVEEKVGHYWIKTDLPADEANALARHLNLMYAEYSKRLASLPVRAQEKLNVLIFKKRDDYEITLRARFGVTATGSGGMFFVTSQGSGLAFWTADLPQRRIEHVVQHEGFHQFAYSRFGNDLPIWVNEGLAEFFGESIVVSDTLIIGQSTPRVLDAVKNAIELNTYVPFRRMLTISPVEWSAALHDGSAALNYQQAWSMVHFLVYGDGGKYVGAFETYLKHLNNGLPSEQAFIRAFGPDIVAFESRWKQYALAAKPSAFVSAMERIEFLAEGLLELSRKGVYPETLEGLRDELRAIGFTHTINTHGVEIRLDSKDDALFTIPVDDLADPDPEKAPAFTVTRPKLKGLTRRDKTLEDANPTPPIVATEYLRPRSMHMRWIREPELNVFRYQIVIK